MNLLELRNRVQSYTRDFNGSIFRLSDVDAFINESINRFKIIPELTDMKKLSFKDDEVDLLPLQYQYMIALYAGSRCFSQDENDNKGGIMMNEFEVKLEELISQIQNGDVVIKDADGNIVDKSSTTKYGSVVDVYFTNPPSYEVDDNGDIKGVM